MKLFKSLVLSVLTLACCSGSVVLSMPIDKNTVYVYNDTGVSKESLAQTLHSLKALLQPDYQLKTIDAKGVIANKWAKDAVLFVMPGGADLPYLKKLKNTGNKNIIAYVKNGGSYLGFCAGAYYAANSIVFDKGGELEVLGARELKFFPGEAVGPILAPYVYHSSIGARAPQITPTQPGLAKTFVFYNGGGTFVGADKHPAVTVLAAYQDGQPAIIETTVSKGLAILSGVHVEYSPELIEEENSHLIKIKKKVAKTNKKRLALLQTLLNDLLAQQG